MVVLAVTGCISILSIVAFLLLVKSGGAGGKGRCLFQCGNERYKLLVQAPEYKEELFGTEGGR